MPRLVLASSSPRRRELLAGLGLSFDITPADVDETPLPGEDAAEMVLRLARAKARASAALAPDAVVLAADTVVVLDGALLGKPLDAGDARAMLHRLAGRDHRVLTGVAVILPEGRAADTVVESEVRMAPLDAATIEWYVSTGEPMDKAGAYAIQGIGSMLVEEVRGSYTNVVGLPLPTVGRLLREVGLDWRAWRGEV